jgi:hypothetical protein
MAGSDAERWEPGSGVRLRVLIKQQADRGMRDYVFSRQATHRSMVVMTIELVEIRELR